MYAITASILLIEFLIGIVLVSFIPAYAQPNSTAQTKTKPSPPLPAPTKSQVNSASSRPVNEQQNDDLDLTDAQKLEQIKQSNKVEDEKVKQFIDSQPQSVKDEAMEDIQEFQSTPDPSALTMEELRRHQTINAKSQLTQEQQSEMQKAAGKLSNGKTAPQLAVPAQIISMEKLKVGENALFSVQTAAGAQCNAEVNFGSGSNERINLATTKANEVGIAKFEFKVPDSRRGYLIIKIDCALAGSHSPSMKKIDISR